MNYDEFIELFNNKTIDRICFYISGYSHYKNCKIYHQTEKTPANKYLTLVVCQLTMDDYEKVSFLNYFDETFKLFDMGKKGKFTLKQIWDLVKITDVEYNQRVS